MPQVQELLSDILNQLQQINAENGLNGVPQPLDVNVVHAVPEVTSVAIDSGTVSLSPATISALTAGSGGSGGLTDAQLRASPVPVSGSFSVTGSLTNAELRASAVPVSFTWSGLTDAQLRASALPVSLSSSPLPTGAATEATLASILAVSKVEDTAHVSGDLGFPMFAIRSDSDAPTAGDGDYTLLKMDEEGRLKVSNKPASYVITTGNITAAAQTVSLNVSRVSNVMIQMVATALVGHVAVFEGSLDNTNWFLVNATRSDSNLVETSTDTLSATPTYGWECSVNGINYFRVRASAHTSGTAAYIIQPGAYATEPIPATSNDPMRLFSYTATGAIAINTVLTTLDLLKYRGVSIQCTSMGTSGVVTPEWSNDGVTWVAATVFTQAGASAATIAAAGLWNTPTQARYLRLRLSTAASAGTTTFAVYTLSDRPQNWYATQVASLTTGAANIGLVAPTVPTTPYFLNSAATTNGALIITGSSGVQAFWATNTGATAAFVKLYNKATAPTVGTDVPEMIIPVPAAVSGVPGVAQMPIGFSGFRFALGLGIAITGAAADTDTTAVAAGQVKVKLSRTA